MNDWMSISFRIAHCAFCGRSGDSVRVSFLVIISGLWRRIIEGELTLVRLKVANGLEWL